MKKYILPLVLFLLMGCFSKEGSNESNKNDTRKESDKGYTLNVREWGVLVVEGSDTTAELITSSVESDKMQKAKRRLVREPVIYFDAKGVDSLEVKVTFRDGKPTITYPTPIVDSNEITWKVSFLDSLTDSVGDSSISSCLKETVVALNEVDATPLTVNGQKARSLFYEGEIHFGNNVKITAYDKDSITVENSNDYTLFDIWYFQRNWGGFYLDSLLPGTGILLPQKEIDIISSKMKRDFPEDEIRSFRRFWGPVSYQKHLGEVPKEKDSSSIDNLLQDLMGSVPNMPFWKNIREDSRLFYRLPEAVVDSMLTLSFSVEPTSVSRVLHVLSFPAKLKRYTSSHSSNYSSHNRGLSGGRSRASIMRVVRRNIAGLKYLYNKKLETYPDLKGKVTVKFAIDQNGAVLHAKVVKSTMKNEEFEKGLIKKLKRWQFGKIDKEGDVTEVTYPFVFTP